MFVRFSFIYRRNIIIISEFSRRRLDKYYALVAGSMVLLYCVGMIIVLFLIYCYTNHTRTNRVCQKCTVTHSEDVGCCFLYEAGSICFAFRSTSTTATIE